MITLFFPVFAVLFLLALRSPQWWFMSSVVAASFQAASPVVLGAGGRMIGMAPAYLMLFAGVVHFVKDIFSRRSGNFAGFWNRPIPGAFWLLAFFSFYAVGGAILLPRFFTGATKVFPPRVTVDSGFTYFLAASTTNFIQAFYVCLNLALVAFVVYFFRRRLIDGEDVITALKASLIVICLFGFYQVMAHTMGLPWPSGFVNSNLGVGQFPEQTIMGMKRMSATFQEPSVLAMHLLGLVAALFVARAGVIWISIGIIAILMSTSSVGYVGVLVLFGASLVSSLSRREIKVLMIFMLGVLSLGGLWLLDESLFAGELSDRLIFSKLESGSGAARLYADFVAFRNFIDTYGLGVGIGSARASSVLSTLLATTGAVGFTLIVSCFLMTILRTLRSAKPTVRAVSAALSGMAIGASLGVPDIAVPLIWLLLGAAIALSDLEEKDGATPTLSLNKL